MVKEVVKEVVEPYNFKLVEVGRIWQNLVELCDKRQVAITKSSTCLKTVVIYYKLYDLA